MVGIADGREGEIMIYLVIHVDGYDEDIIGYCVTYELAEKQLDRQAAARGCPVWHFKIMALCSLHPTGDD